MLYRKLGSTGLDVSAIGFGTWQIGGGRWNVKSYKERVALLQHSRRSGINVFDCSEVYGQYKDDRGYMQSRSQELLGSAFEHCRDKVIYCIKLGQFDEYSHRANYDPFRIVEQFQHALRRLRTDYVDICLIHAPSLAKVKDERALNVIRTLQALGLVKAVGYSFENEPEHVAAALEQEVDVLMLQYNLLEKQCVDVLVQARERGIGILVGGPYKRGYLTGEFQNPEDLPLEDDYWKWNLAKNPMKVKENLERVKQLLQECQTPKHLRQKALEFILAQPAVASVVVGHRQSTEVDENINLLMGKPYAQ